MRDSAHAAAHRLSCLVGLGPRTDIIVDALLTLVDEGYIAILPRQATLIDILTAPAAPATDPKGYATALVQEINALTGRNFKVTDDYTKMAKTLIKEKVPLEQARLAIRQQHAEWGNDPKWGKYVRPSTMLRASNMKRYIADLEAGPVKKQTAHGFRPLGEE